jgi:hypothetical protein
MATSKQLHRLATRPSEYMRYVTTGRLPQGVKPASPLVTLLKAIGPRDLQRLVGVTVDRRLGYEGSRRFHYGSQALLWVAPSNEVFDTFPAESWRNKRFEGPLYLEDLAECCAQFPDEFFGRYRALCRPTERPKPAE